MIGIVEELERAQLGVKLEECWCVQEAGVGTDESGLEIFGASNKVAGGWRNLEERRKGMKVLFGKRLEVLEESQLVKMVVEKLREDGGIGYWEE